jgi:phosphoenolpyruvate-protein phosphotransferase (PTS system enzyme I)
VSTEYRQRVTLYGIGVSPGYAIGRAHFVDRRKIKVPHAHLSDDEVTDELDRFRKALSISESQISDLKTRLQSAGEEHYLILDAHQLMLRDEMLVDGTCQLIREQHLNAEWALKKVLRSIKQVFDNIDDEYFRERRSDVDFVGDRILRNLLGKDQPTLDHMAAGSVVVAHDLSPADTAQILETSAGGFVTEVGGRTSHTAIMARSLELPAVVAVDGLTEYVGTGDIVVIDGSNGRVHVNPTPEEIQRYQQRQAAYNVERAKLDTERMDNAVSLDGHLIEVRGNIELPEEAPIVIEHGAHGVGLFRTEFLFMQRKALPDEEEQYQRYIEVLDACSPEPATIRTLDLGGDKLSNFVKIEDESNPVMGLRAIRLCLKRPELLKTQARALLRASAHGPLQVMVPLVSRISEIRSVKSVFKACRAELDAEGVPMDDDIPFGIMIEVPAAALMARQLANEVDFFSIGTNDLIQYTLAVDRGNPHVAHMYAPLHPAMLSLLSTISKAGQSADIDVSMCGEMAGDPICLPIVLGIGLKSLSMNATSIPLIKTMIRNLRIEDCRTLVSSVSGLQSSEQVEEHVRFFLRETLVGTTVEPMLDALFDDPSMAGECLDLNADEY